MLGHGALGELALGEHSSASTEALGSGDGFALTRSQALSFVEYFEAGFLGALSLSLADTSELPTDGSGYAMSISEFSGYISTEEAGMSTSLSYGSVTTNILAVGRTFGPSIQSG